MVAPGDKPGLDQDSAQKTEDSKEIAGGDGRRKVTRTGVSMILDNEQLAHELLGSGRSSGRVNDTSAVRSMVRHGPKGQNILAQGNRPG
jgi:hypothetical protein